MSVEEREVRYCLFCLAGGKNARCRLFRIIGYKKEACDNCGKVGRGVQLSVEVETASKPHTICHMVNDRCSICGAP
jgi:hypothetical protein